MMKSAIINSVAEKYKKVLQLLGWASPVMMLVIRLWIANVFWKSGILKLEDFSTAVQLFTDEHPVPYLPPFIAAVIGTTFEVSCPVLLTLGLGARLATLPLLVMTAVINFTYLNIPQHYYWAMLLGTILFYGPGKLSLDYYISRRFNKE